MARYVLYLDLLINDMFLTSEPKTTNWLITVGCGQTVRRLRRSQDTGTIFVNNEGTKMSVMDCFYGLNDTRSLNLKKVQLDW